jgi:hypothetical protein
MKLIPDFWQDAPAQSPVKETEGLERSHSPDAPMNLLLRFETPSGPRTVIACSVSRHVAAEITEVMRSHGQDAHYIDRCSPLSVTDRVMIRSLN